MTTMARHQAMTFNGSVPGPLMVVHQDDYVELTLINPDTNQLQHNIDFHAATGASRRRRADPGQSRRAGESAVQGHRAGVFVYHCAPGGPMIPWHVVVGHERRHHGAAARRAEGRAGKPLSYDHVYYVGEQDFYVPKDADGNFKKYEFAGDAYADMLEVMRTLTPEPYRF